MSKRTFVALCGALALVACKKDDDTDPVDTDTDVGCGITISQQIPADGATGVYYRSSLEWTFSEPDSTATVTVSTGGTDVPGSGEWVGDIYIWTPTDPFTPSTTYDVALDYCTAPVSSSFTTSAIGAPVADPAGDLDGLSYILDIGAGRFVEPPGVGALLSQQLNVDILIGVVSADASTLTLQGALGVEDANPPAQDLCTPSIDFPSANFSENPYFEVGPQTTTIEVQGISIVIDDLFVSGALAADGSAIAGAVLAGSIDTRPLVDLVSPGGTEDAVCALVQPFGISCQTCTGGGDFCLSLLVDSIAAAQVPGLTVVTRTEADIAADTVNCP